MVRSFVERAIWRIASVSVTDGQIIDVAESRNELAVGVGGEAAVFFQAFFEALPLAVVVEVSRLGSRQWFVDGGKLVGINVQTL